MSRTSALLSFGFLLMTTGILWSQVDGLYWVSEKPTRVTMTSLQGQSIFLGARFTEKIDEATLNSITNDNTLFRLVLKQNKPGLALPSLCPVALVLHKKCFEMNAAPEGPKEIWIGMNESPTFTGLDPDFTELAAAYFNVTPQLRHHPGHQFTARFIVDPNGYSAAGPIPVTLRIMNSGTVPFSTLSNIYDTFTCPVTGPFSFTSDHASTLPRLPSMGGITTIVTLQPGDFMPVSVDLKRFLKFDQPGTYTVHGKCAFSIVEPKKAFPALWDELAMADFQVTIK